MTTGATRSDGLTAFSTRGSASSVIRLTHNFRSMQHTHEECPLFHYDCNSSNSRMMCQWLQRDNMYALLISRRRLAGRSNRMSSMLRAKRQINIGLLPTHSRSHCTRLQMIAVTMRRKTTAFASTVLMPYVTSCTTLYTRCTRSLSESKNSDRIGNRVRTTHSADLEIFQLIFIRT